MSKYGTFIFIGRSGCGKGTQARLLIEYLKRAEPERDVYYLETGQKFRDFVAGDSLSSILARRVMDQNERQPDFLAVYMWSHLLVENIRGDEHLVLDGTPRSRPEAEMLSTALSFFNRADAHIIHIKVSRQWARTRLESRGRADDTARGGIEARLNWFERDVEPALQYYREHPEYRFHEIDGEQSVERVEKAILDAIYDND